MGNAQGSVFSRCCAHDPAEDAALPEVRVVRCLTESLKEDSINTAGESRTGLPDATQVGEGVSRENVLNNASLKTEQALPKDAPADDGRSVSTQPAENLFDGLEGDPLVDRALGRASSFLTVQDYSPLAAEEVLAQAVAVLEAKGPAHCLARLRASEVYKEVSDRIAQHDAAAALIHNTNMETLHEGPDGRFDIAVSPSGTWFDYRMTIDIEAPLGECLSTGAEMDLVPQAQPLVTYPPEYIGKHSGFNFKVLSKLNVLFFRAELLFEIIRARSHRFGYLLEIIRTDFDKQGVEIPKKGWGAIRPWVYTANLWMPRGGGRTGTVLVQVTRVDCTFSVPHWVLNFVFRNLATTFMADLRASALQATQADSQWARRIKEDAEGLYAELRTVENAATSRREVSAKSLPGQEIFDRPWRLRPPSVDTRPPSSR